ncbi:unnamed protein product [Vitrella brassicaformis CCMP3155]|uniref:Protein kinase domain-containing protein n=1 Tax=Vitrella brassicaformis (strain CCMP3155) TaxID=1169540 RepID=A0A0G4FVW9_VITBC|nr:unnamed protein product [Vitrella brassicaformis CCMP3155]|eukprot:CEM19329.1 unnamed protein product [Vitrella brassicaformis CCMP3155]
MREYTESSRKDFFRDTREDTSPIVMSGPDDSRRGRYRSRSRSRVRERSRRPREDDYRPQVNGHVSHRPHGDRSRERRRPFDEADYEQDRALRRAYGEDYYRIYYDRAVRDDRHNRRRKDSRGRRGRSRSPRDRYDGYGRGHVGGGQRRDRHRSRDESWSVDDHLEDESHQEAEDDRKDDDIIHFDWYVGMRLDNGRYRVEGLMGDGTFGRVLECRDEDTGRSVAVKVVRDIERYNEAAQIEADILQDIRGADPQRRSNCVQLLHTFTYHTRRLTHQSSGYHQGNASARGDRGERGGRHRHGGDKDDTPTGEHMCLVFERLGPSLYDFLKKNNYRGFYMEDVQCFARQCLQALAFLHALNITHTDLKPENILLVSSNSYSTTFPRDPTSSASYKRPSRTDVKIIDFGGATYEHDHHSAVINTRQYRAPEVILDLGWSMSSDIWSIGCILIELYTGSLLFGTHENREHLAMMEKVLGRFPSHMLQRAQQTTGSKYIKNGRFSWPENASPSSRRAVQRCCDIEELVEPQHRGFAEFVRYLLQIDPARRPAATEALRHSFFTTRFDGV